nr:E-beta-farnesene synthase [Tanacetum cinerariifolium]
MADVNAPSGQAPAMAPPVRTDDQILPRIRWVPIGKSKCYLDLEKSQGNPIYKIAVDLLKNTNFFRCQLDEKWFVLTKDTLSEALQITPVNNNQAFVTPPSSDALINLVNKLGYPKLVRNVSNVVTNDMFQPWRALITIINLCLTGKTSGFERPRAYHTTGKKKATLIVIPSIWFTKLIIHYLQRRHKFHPSPDSLLHLPNEEPVLRYLKFSAKGTKREVFGMPIPGSLITTNIQEASYYQEYLANVAKHRRYLAGKIGSDQDSPAPKPTKPTRKPKSTVPKAPPKASVSTQVTSAQPAPTSAPAKPQEKKRKQATETSDKPSKAKKSKYGFLGKKRSLKSVAALVAKDVPAMEPQVAAEDADLQKALEESMKTTYAPPKGPLPPVVIREPESGKYQPFLEVPGKGKAKVAEEQVAHDLLSLQKPKKKSPVDQYIFQRRTFITTRSSRHDEPSYAELEQSESEETKKVMPGADEGGQGESECQDGPDPGAQAEGQTGSNADLGNAGAEVQSIPSHVVHAGSDREHMDLDVADVSPQPSTEQLDEGFTATAYLKLAVEEHVLLEDPASSSGTLSSLQHLSKDISFGDLFFSNKPLKADNDKATTETEVESVVSMTIQQDISSIPLMTSPIIDLTSRPKSPKVHQQFKPPPPPLPAGPFEALGAPRASASSQVLPPPPPPSSINQESPSKGSIAPSSSKTAASAKYQAWMTTDIRLRPSISLTPTDLEMNADMAPDEQAQSSDDEDIGRAHIPKVKVRQDWWKPLEEERPATLEPAWSIPSSDVPIPTNNWALALTSNYSPPPKDSLFAQTGDIATFIDWFCKRQGITELKPQDLEGPAFEILLTDSVDDPILRHNVSKPLPLGGPPGQVTIQSDFFFNKDLEYLRYGSKGSRPTLSISKMKAAYYPDAGLEQMVPAQFWIDEECKYDITAMYGISHWWFQRQQFYIDRHTSEGDRNVVWTHMQILSVLRIKFFSMYGYDYMKN